VKWTLAGLGLALSVGGLWTVTCGVRDRTVGESDEVTAGLGLSIREHPYGIRVDDVGPDGAAAQAGIERGDVIVEIDGIETVDLDPSEFVRLGTGPEGSFVEVVVDRDGEELHALLDRRTMERW